MKKHNRLSAGVLAAALALNAPAALLMQVPVFAEEQESTEYVFDGTASTRVLWDQPLPDASNDTMIWKGEFKTSSINGIAALMSVCGTGHANDYLTLYVRPGMIGFEFRDYSGTGKSANVQTAATVDDGQWHSYEMRVSPKGYKVILDGQEVINNTTLPPLTSMNCFSEKHLYLGGMNRTGSTSNWYFNGSMRNVSVEGALLNRTMIGDLDYAGFSLPAGSQGELLSTELPEWLKKAEKGTFSVQYRANSPDTSGLRALLSVRPAADAQNYATFYVNTANGNIGVEAKGGIGHKYVNFGSAIKDTDWHTVTFRFDGTTMKVSLDGEEKSVEAAGFMQNVTWEADSLYTGGMNRPNVVAASQWNLDGDISRVQIFQEVLTDEETAQLGDVTGSKDSLVGMRGDETVLYAPGYMDSLAYRIPAMVRTEKGTVIAVGDKRNDTQADQNNIDVIVRRKEAGSDTFSEGHVILDAPQLADGQDCTLIDSEMISAVLPDGTNRIFLLVDMFPQTPAALMQSSALSTGSGFVEVNGTKYLALYDDAGKEYTVREEGHIYDDANTDTGYVMETQGDQASGYHDNGNITGPNGEDCGSAYMYSGPTKGRFHVLKTQYLWLTYSDDDGKSWSAPANITGQVKDDWMLFLGTGPGKGIQLENGRLVFSVYSAHANVGGSQASAVIVSDDYGQTWTRKDSPLAAAGVDISTMNDGSQIITENQVVQLNNGDLIMFMRNPSGHVKISRSTDNGDTWSAPESTPVYDSYCQIGAVHTNYQGSEYVILSNPSASGRHNNATTVGLVNEDGTITWNDSKVYSYNHTQYSCLEDLQDGKIGLLYEGDDASGMINLIYTEFDMDYLLSDVEANAPVITNITSTIIRNGEDHPASVKAGDTIRLSIQCDDALFSDAKPVLELEIDGETRTAGYKGGMGTDKLVFEYTVQEGDPQGTVVIDSVLKNARGDSLRSYQNVAMRNIGKMNAAVIGRDWASSLEDVPVVSANAGSETWGAAVNAFDGNTSTIWHSNDDMSTAWILYDLGEEYTLSGFRYLPRQDGSINGIVTDYEVYAGNDPDNLTKVVSNGTFEGNTAWKGASFAPINARYFKFVGISGRSDQAGKSFVSAAELHPTGTEKAPETDKSELNALIEAASALQADRYTPESFAALTEALNAAKAVSANPLASEQEVAEALNTLQAAIGALEEVSMETADKTLLAAAIAYTDGISEEDKAHVNVLVLTELNEALTQAQTVNADAKASQESVDAAWKRLVKAIHMLGFTTDKSALTQLVEQAEAIDLENATEESAAALREAIAFAHSVLDSDTALDAVSIADAMERLQAAIDGLVFNTEYDLSVLQFLYGQCSAITLDDYVPAGQEAFLAAMEQARSVLANPQSQQEIDECVETLSNAWLNLRRKPSEEVLKSLAAYLEQFESLNAGDFTAEEYAALGNLAADIKVSLQDPNFDSRQAERMMERVQKASELIESKTGTAGNTAASKAPAANAASVKTSASVGMQAAGWMAAALGSLAVLLKKRKK